MSILTRQTVTAADLYAAAASAESNGRGTLAESIERIADTIAADRPVRLWVWECTRCDVAGTADTPEQGAHDYAAHYVAAHRA